MADLEALYDRAKKAWIRLRCSSSPYMRRAVRFLLLPYAFAYLVNWRECRASKLRVAKDFLYIFFVLKDFPDYYSLLRFWEIERDEWALYYGSFYNPWQRARLRKEVQKEEFEIIFKDKLVCHHLCSYAKLPVPQLFGYAETDASLLKLLGQCFQDKQCDKVVVKSVNGRGGQGVHLAYQQAEDILITCGTDPIKLQEFHLEAPSVLQEFVPQHSELATISPSLNTIRIETLLGKDGQVLLLGAFARFGTNGSFVDNQRAGGLSVGINMATGELYDYALNGKGEKFPSHPDSGFTFKGFVLPYWLEAKALAENVQKSFSYYKLLGPDIAITPEGPVLIEVNGTPDHAGLEMDYGPIFRDERVWQAFKDYDLLINKPSREAH